MSEPLPAAFIVAFLLLVVAWFAAERCPECRSWRVLPDPESVVRLRCRACGNVWLER